jgi:hypothetical protein
LQHLQNTVVEHGPAAAAGLIHTAWGGSMIEQWLPAATVRQRTLVVNLKHRLSLRFLRIFRA